MQKIEASLKKLTYFDRILIILAILGLALFAYVFFRKATFVTAVIKVGEDNILYEPWRLETGSRAWFAQMFREGMKETDGLGRVGAEIVSVYSYDTHPARKAVYLTTKLRVVYNRATNQYTFKGLPLIVGSQVRLNLDKMLVEGLVTHVEGLEDPRYRETLIVEAQVREETPTFPETSGTKDYVAEAIKVGDEVKDSQGSVIIKVLGKRVENAKRLVTTSDGRAFVQTNPLRRDVHLTLKISAIRIGDRYFLFDDIPILVGRGVPINTPNISLWPEVTRITQVE